MSRPVCLTRRKGRQSAASQRGAAAAPLPSPIRTTNNEIYSSVVADGSLYLNSDRPGGFAPGKSELYGAPRLSDGRFSEPVAVGVNGELGLGDTFVAPDESFAIFASGRQEGYGQGTCSSASGLPTGPGGRRSNSVRKSTRRTPTSAP